MKVSFPNLRPAAQPANRRQDAASHPDSGRPGVLHAAPASPARATAGAADQDRWVHDPAAPEAGGTAPGTALPDPAREPAESRAQESRDTGSTLTGPPTGGDPTAGLARATAEKVKQDLLARPQAAGVHGNLVPATVLNLLA